jgi:hypothetical protein
VTREQLIETMVRAMVTNLDPTINWSGLRPAIQVMFTAHATAALTAAEAAGYRLVPVEPSERMIEAHFEAHARAETVVPDVSDVWKAMLAAAQEDSTSE